MKKISLTIAICLTLLNLKGQTYSSMIDDVTIENFLQGMIVNDTEGFFKIKKNNELIVNQYIAKFNEYQISTLKTEENDTVNEFLTSLDIDTIFTDSDFDFMSNQIDSLQTRTWRKFSDRINLTKFPTGPHYNFSAPLFSKDKTKALIYINLENSSPYFFDGFLIYQRTKDKWRLLTQRNLKMG